jgi:hypothetical protein
MKRLITFLLLITMASQVWGTGEPSTYFNIFVPPNNDAVQRNVCLIVTAIYDSTTFNIVDDGMDGDTDDTVSGMLMAGQSYILYIKDNGINDDALYASGGVLKKDGDYFIITSSNLVYASQSTDSDWQHDFVPSVSKSSVGEKFIIYAPKISSSNRDLNVFAYENGTVVTISKISASATIQTGYTNINQDARTVVAQRTLNVGEDLIYFYQNGRNIMITGETYLIESNKPVSVQYGALFGNERDGGGYVPASNGSSSGELFYFGVPYQAAGEQEIRIVSWDDNNSVQLYRYSAGSWISMSTWTMNRMKAKEWVGKNNANASYATVFKVVCTPGKKVSVFEANWLETGSPGTSDIATMVASEAGTTSGTDFLVYLAPPGNEQNVVNPFTGTVFGQRMTHVYLFSKDTAHVTVKDAFTDGVDFNRSYTILPERYVDCYLTETEWRNIYNGTGTIAGGNERPYVTITSDKNISVMNTNFNDNWMMYFGSSMEQSFTQESHSSANTGIPGDQVTVVSEIVVDGTSPIENAVVEVIIDSGAIPISSEITNTNTNESTDGVIEINTNKSKITFPEIPAINPTDQLQVTTVVQLQVTDNNGTILPNNSVVTVETVVTGTIDGETQQSVTTENISNNTANTSNFIFNLQPISGVTTGNTNSWTTSWVDIDGDNDDDLFITDKNGTASNLLYRNNGGISFTLITAGDLPSYKAKTVGNTWADVDNDGDIDVLVVNDTEKPSELFLNNGTGTFTKAANTGFATEPGYYHGAAFADYDKDGKIDVLFTNYMPTRFHELYHGNGDGTFELVDNSVFSTISAMALTPTWVDYDNDGFLDVFIPNGDNENNTLVHNNGDGTFDLVTTGSIVNDGGNSTGSCWGDYDKDGDMDLFVANASGENNFLYNNSGNGTFSRIANSPVVSNGGHSHGCSWVDVDNDADLDLYVSNDNGTKFLYFNSNGTFTLNTTEVITANFGKTFGHSWTDLDKDGDMDVFAVTHTNQSNYYFTNNGNANKWINITLKGTNSNASAIGAELSVKANGEWQKMTVNAQNGIGGQNSLRQHFGLANASMVDSILVKWPSGYIQTLVNQNPNVNITITEETKTHVSGIIYFDQNNNCSKDNNENAISGQRVVVTPGNIQTTVDANGAYSLWLNYGNYQINAIDNGVWSTPCANQSITANSSNAEITLNVPMSASSGNPDLAITGGSTAWRRGFANSTTVDVTNIAAGTATNVAVKIVYPTGMYVVNANADYTTSPSGALIFNVGTLEPGASYTIHLTDSVGLENIIGDELELSMTVFLDENDLDLSNNDALIVQEIVGAIDPNDMLVSPKGEGTEGYVSNEQELTYKIRFQNIGNYEATTVKVSCVIPDNLELSDINTVSMSHNGQMIVDGKTLTWVFNNISLPPSAIDEVGSHGYITFKGKPQAFVGFGDKIALSSDIIFDYEDAIRTNQVVNTVQNSAKQARYVVCYPNPATERVSISLTNNLPQYSKKEKIVSYKIVDQLGNEVMTQTNMNIIEMQLDVTSLRAGVYVVVLTNEFGVKTSGRLVKID